MLSFPGISQCKQANQQNNSKPHLTCYSTHVRRIKDRTAGHHWTRESLFFAPQMMKYLFYSRTVTTGAQHMTLYDRIWPSREEAAGVRMCDSLLHQKKSRYHIHVHCSFNTASADHTDTPVHTNIHCHTLPIHWEIHAAHSTYSHSTLICVEPNVQPARTHTSQYVYVTV